MTTSIEQYLEKKQKRLKGLTPSPIVLRWLKSTRMAQALAILDKHVEYLLNHGSERKVEQWLLTDDKNFNAITAERYIIGYLRQQNRNIIDNVGKKGVDAHIDDGNASVGIEVTTLNGFIASWILVERLTQLLDEQSFLSDKGLDITYLHKKIQIETQGETIYEYIKQASNAIVSNDDTILSALDLSVDIQHDFPGIISWHYDDGNSFPWFQCITGDLISKLQEKSKTRQLQKYSRNLVFVGINHSSPGNWAFPSIFEDIAGGEKHYRSEIQELRDYWRSNMANLNNVAGICYFFYALDRETPFYPLSIFWRSDEDRIAINL